MRTVATLAQVALFAVALTAIVRLRAVAHDRSLAGTVMADPLSVSLDDLSAADSRVSTSGWLELAAVVVAAIFFVIWLWRARVNAEGYDADVHRRRRGWAIFGWICLSSIFGSPTRSFTT